MCLEKVITLRRKPQLQAQYSTKSTLEYMCPPPQQKKNYTNGHRILPRSCYTNLALVLNDGNHQHSFTATCALHPIKKFTEKTFIHSKNYLSPQLIYTYMYMIGAKDLCSIFILTVVPSDITSVDDDAVSVEDAVSVFVSRGL